MSILLLLIPLFHCVVVDSARHCHHKVDAKTTLEECLLQGKTEMDIDYDAGCREENGYFKEICTIDISSFTQQEVSDMLNKLTLIRPHLKCDNSPMLEILDFSNQQVIGHIVSDLENFKIRDNKPGMVIVNNMHLKTVDLGRKLLQNDKCVILPAFWTIWNNPRLTRYSIDTINALVKERREHYSHYLEKKDQQIHTDLINMQTYGDCNFHFTNSSKTSLCWEEFRWCRTISHEVVLQGPDFDPKNDTAYIHKVTGTLKITNTNIENLNFLPVYFGVNSDGNEISGNKKLCVSFEDEIRFKRLGFKIENNADLSCRTTCNSTGLSMQQVLELKDCVTLKGGLKLDKIDETLAAADLFKTVKVIDGPLEITNAQATIDFRKLEKITVLQDQKNIYLKNCSHPILFPSLKNLGGSESVEMENCRMDVYKYLKEKYKESVVDLSRIVTTTTAAPTAAPTNGPVVSSPGPPNAVDQRISSPSVSKADEETTVQSVGHDETTKKPETDSAVSSTEPESNTEGQGAAPPASPNMALAGEGNTSDSNGEHESTSGNKTTLMIIAGLAGAVFLLSSVAIAVIFLKCDVL